MQCVEPEKVVLLVGTDQAYEVASHVLGASATATPVVNADTRNFLESL